MREGRGGGAILFIALLYISRMATFEKGVKESAAKLDGSGLRIAIVHTRWNYALVDQMYKVVYDTLIKKHGVLPENIYTVCLFSFKHGTLTRWIIVFFSHYDVC